jgi:hypothetical protein
MLTPHNTKAKSLMLESNHWRVRANEVRAIGELMHDKLSKDMMLQLAAEYDRLAGGLEKKELADRR